MIVLLQSSVLFMVHGFFVIACIHLGNYFMRIVVTQAATPVIYSQWCFCKEIIYECRWVKVNIYIYILLSIEENICRSELKCGVLNAL